MLYSSTKVIDDTASGTTKYVGTLDDITINLSVYLQEVFPSGASSKTFTTISGLSDVTLLYFPIKDLNTASIASLTTRPVDGATGFAPIGISYDSSNGTVTVVRNSSVSGTALDGAYAVYLLAAPVVSASGPSEFRLYGTADAVEINSNNYKPLVLQEQHYTPSFTISDNDVAFGPIKHYSFQDSVGGTNPIDFKTRSRPLGYLNFYKDYSKPPIATAALAGTYLIPIALIRNTDTGKFTGIDLLFPYGLSVNLLFSVYSTEINPSANTTVEYHVTTSNLFGVNCNLVYAKDVVNSPANPSLKLYNSNGSKVLDSNYIPSLLGSFNTYSVKPEVSSTIAVNTSNLDVLPSVIPIDGVGATHFSVVHTPSILLGNTLTTWVRESLHQWHIPDVYLGMKIGGTDYTFSGVTYCGTGVTIDPNGTIRTEPIPYFSEGTTRKNKEGILEFLVNTWVNASTAILSAIGAGGSILQDIVNFIGSLVNSTYQVSNINNLGNSKVRVVNVPNLCNFSVTVPATIPSSYLNLEKVEGIASRLGVLHPGIINAYLCEISTSRIPLLDMYAGSAATEYSNTTGHPCLIQAAIKYKFTTFDRNGFYTEALKCHEDELIPNGLSETQAQGSVEALWGLWLDDHIVHQYDNYDVVLSPYRTASVKTGSYFDYLESAPWSTDVTIVKYMMKYAIERDSGGLQRFNYRKLFIGSTFFKYLNLVGVYYYDHYDTPGLYKTGFRNMFVQRDYFNYGVSNFAFRGCMVLAVTYSVVPSDGTDVRYIRIDRTSGTVTYDNNFAPSANYVDHLVTSQALVCLQLLALLKDINARMAAAGATYSGSVGYGLKHAIVTMPTIPIYDSSISFTDVGANVTNIVDNWLSGLLPGVRILLMNTLWEGLHNDLPVFDYPTVLAHDTMKNMRLKGFYSSNVTIDGSSLLALKGSRYSLRNPGVDLYASAPFDQPI